MIKKALLAATGAGLSLYCAKKQKCCGIIGVVSQKRENVSDVLS